MSLFGNAAVLFAVEGQLLKGCELLVPSVFFLTKALLLSLWVSVLFAVLKKDLFLFYVCAFCLHVYMNPTCVLYLVLAGE